MFNKKSFRHHRVIYFLSLSSLVVLAGCWAKKKETESAAGIDTDDLSEVLLQINDVPKVTVNSLEKDINELVELDQQLKLMMMFNPEETRERVFQEKKRMAIIEEWALNHNVRNDPQYQQKRAKIMQHVDMQLDFEQFLNQHKVEVNDADVLAYYEQNKTQDPRILITPAGIKSQAVEFSARNTAEQFYHELKKAGPSALEKLAEEQKYFVRNLGNVNETSYADPAIKAAVNKIDCFPAVLLVENQDQTKFWVVVAQSVETAKYQEFEKVKESIKQLLASKAMGEMLEAKIPEYGKQFAIYENEQYFNDLRNKKQDSMSELPENADDNLDDNAGDNNDEQNN